MKLEQEDLYKIGIFMSGDDTISKISDDTYTMSIKYVNILNGLDFTMDTDTGCIQIPDIIINFICNQITDIKDANEYLIMVSALYCAIYYYTKNEDISHLLSMELVNIAYKSIYHEPLDFDFNKLEKI